MTRTQTTKTTTKATQQIQRLQTMIDVALKQRQKAIQPTNITTYYKLKQR